MLRSSRIGRSRAGRRAPEAGEGQADVRASTFGMLSPPVTLRKSDLYSSLWKSCDELRGGMDASQYKDYILTLLFVKYVSDKAKADPDSLIDVPKGGSFDDMLAAQGRQGDRRQDQQDHRQAGRGQRPAEGHRPGRLQRRGEARQGQGDAGPALQAGHDLRRPRLPRQPRRGRRPARRRLRVPDAALRHRVGQEQGPVLHAGRGLPDPGQGRRHRPDTRQDQTVYDPACGSGSLLLKAAAEAPRGITIYGQEKDNATWALSQDEHDPARQRGRRHREGRHHHQPAVHQGRPAADLRLRRHEPAVLGQVVEQRPRERLRPLRVRHARRRRTATTPSCCTCSSRSRAPARRRSSCRTASCSAATPRPPSARQLLEARLHQGHHRPAAEPLLRHRHPGLHRRARQGERRWPHRRLHDRRLQGLHEGRRQEPAAQPGHPQDRRRLQQADRDRALLAHGAARARSPTRRTTTTSTSRATSTRPSPRTSRTSTHTCTAASPSATSTLSSGYWDAFPQLRSTALQAEPAWLQRPRRRGRPRCSRPSSTRRSSRSSPTRSATSPTSGSPRTVRRLAEDRRRHQAERPHRRASATTCSHGSSRCRCSTSTTSTSSS